MTDDTSASESSYSGRDVPSPSFELPLPRSTCFKQSDRKAEVQKKTEALKNLSEGGTWFLIKKEGGNVISEVWKTFGIVVGKADKQYKGFVQCFKCGLIKI